MATIAEIDSEPYAKLVRRLLAAGARVPRRVGGDRAPRASMLLGELGIGPEELVAFL